jgi:hypothetical protein
MERIMKILQSACKTTSQTSAADSGTAAKPCPATTTPFTAQAKPSAHSTTELATPDALIHPHSGINDFAAAAAITTGVSTTTATAAQGAFLEKPHADVSAAEGTGSAQ